MYAKRIQVLNYGPVCQLDITLPFEGEVPKPAVLVGENGSGKSILLSHVVNGLIAAKGIAYSETPEVETGKVYKLRSGFYIKSGSEYFFARVDFEDGLFMGEIRSRRKKQQYVENPAGLCEGNPKDAWEQLNPGDHEHLIGNIDINSQNKIKDLFAKNCFLYFPSNRYEEPAWLNEENLQARARYMDLKHIEGQTDRRIVSYSPLHENQNWLFEVIYDRSAFEVQTRIINLPVNDGNVSIPLSVFSGYSGNATSTYEISLQVIRNITRNPNARFGIGKRNNRVVSLQSEKGPIVPNIFQLSSGETSLLNLFLSILRDFDLCNAPFSSAADIRGVVIVDEIDLHLHALHQHEILPELMRMFPKVQFVVTTHSPLFVLGMRKSFGEDGFALYRLPQGHQISPEEFSEFGDAYQAFTRTSMFSNDIRKAIETAQKPIVFVEGATDQKYLQKAAKLLGQEEILERVDIRDGGGKDNLRKIWNHFKPPLADIVHQEMVLIFDCDYQGKTNCNRGNLFRRTIPLQPNPNHPVQKGIENLLPKSTLEKARQHNQAFIDVIGAHEKTERGKTEPVPEKWTVNTDEKTNLCDWLCENGTLEDFQHFELVFQTQVAPYRVPTSLR